VDTADRSILLEWPALRLGTGFALLPRGTRVARSNAGETKPMKATITHFTLATALLTTLACGGSNQEPETPGEKAGEAVEEVGEDIEEAGDDMEDDSE
jgi:hypothetical protein